jgi:tRNA 2-thiouridine synthesizing protein A
MATDNRFPDATRLVDARRLLCPLPILLALRALEEMEPGERLLLLADDPAAPGDVRKLAAEGKVGLVAIEAATERNGWRITLAKDQKSFRKATKSTNPFDSGPSTGTPTE